MKEIITPFSKLKNPTGKHKDWYREEFIKIFCQEINPDNKLFKSVELIKDYKKSYQSLELKERLNLISKLLKEYLPGNYKRQLRALSKLFGKPLPFEEGMFTIGFYLYPISQFIELYGEEDIDFSLEQIEKLTQQFTGEWAIRPLANLDQKKILKKMKEWSKHQNFHVRRLSSEGLRAKLPWGKKIQWVNDSPEKTLPIYNKLRNDNVLYVRRSVANSMGDMIKIDPELSIQTFDKWLSMKLTIENLWVIKHAIRTPVKKGNKKFIQLKNKVDKLSLELKKAKN